MRTDDVSVTVAELTHDSLQGFSERLVVGAFANQLQIAVVACEPVATGLTLEHAEVRIVLFQGLVEVLEVLLFLLGGEPVLGRAEKARDAENDRRQGFSESCRFHRFEMFGIKTFENRSSDLLFSFQI